MIQWISPEGATPGSLAELMAGYFPPLRDPAARATWLLASIRSGSLMVVIATDRYVPGTFEWVEALSRQESLPYRFRAVEIVPHVRPGTTSPVIFVPNLRVETRVVSKPSSRS